MNTAPENHKGHVWFGFHAALRTDAYALLAALLTDMPTEEHLALIRSLSWQEDISPEVHQALTELIDAGRASTPAAFAWEYNRLFVGLGSGELVPYASWYLEKKIQSSPLSRIRSDLARLGIVRRSECFDSEDNAGALCEIMALISSSDQTVPLVEQAVFFLQHMNSWMITFFQDMQDVANIKLYPAIGKFAQRFFEAEAIYLQSLTEGMYETEFAAKASFSERQNPLRE